MWSIQWCSCNKKDRTCNSQSLTGLSPCLKQERNHYKSLKGCDSKTRRCILKFKDFTGWLIGWLAGWIVCWFIGCFSYSVRGKHWNLFLPEPLTEGCSKQWWLRDQLDMQTSLTTGKSNICIGSLTLCSSTDPGKLSRHLPRMWWIEMRTPPKHICTKSQSAPLGCRGGVQKHKSWTNLAVQQRLERQWSVLTSV